MTDGYDINRMALYFYRGALNRNRPALIANHLGLRGQLSRSGPAKVLESLGLAAFYSNEQIYEDAQAFMPDSLGKTEEEISAMPLLVRNFKCGNLIESGDPYCGKEKYNDTVCAERKFKANWHPGW
jgi:hypothetical protein